MTIAGIDNISPGASTSVAGKGGMRSYLSDLCESLPRNNPEWRFKLFTPDWMEPFDVAIPPNLEIVRCCNVPRMRLGRVAYEQFVLPRLLRAHRVGVWIGTCNTLPLAAPCKTVLIVQSLQFFNSRTCSTLRRLYLRSLVPLSVKRADAVVALSLASKQAVIARCRVADDKVRVVHNWLPPFFREDLATKARDDVEILERRLGFSSKFILSVSAFYKYKNIERLVEAFARLKPKFPDRRLVLVGSETPQLRGTQLHAVAASLGVAPDVLALGRARQDEIAALYRRADVMAMPSLEETFGLPVLEAMALGCPVVTSACSSMAEIAGDAAVLVDPYSVESIMHGLRRVLKTPDLREKMIRRGRAVASYFSRETMIGQLSSVLRAAVNAQRQFVDSLASP